jgi:hypothetical protein
MAEVEDEHSAQSVRDMDSLPGPDKDGFTLLHSAAGRGQCKTVEALLEKSAGLDARSTSGETPLLAACKAGRAEVADALIKAKANVLAQDGQGQSPLHWYTCLSRSISSFIDDVCLAQSTNKRLCRGGAPSRVTIGRVDDFLTRSFFGPRRLLSSRSVQQSDTALSMMLLKTGSCPNLQVHQLPSRLMEPASRDGERERGGERERERERDMQPPLLPLLASPLQDMRSFYRKPPNLHPCKEIDKKGPFATEAPTRKL